MLTGNAGLTFNGQSGKWQWSVIGSFAAAAHQVSTGRGPIQPGFRSVLIPSPTAFSSDCRRTGAVTNAECSATLRQEGNVALFANGPLVELPAGSIVASLRVGAQGRIDPRALGACSGPVWRNLSIGAECSGFH